MVKRRVMVWTLVLTLVIALGLISTGTVLANGRTDRDCVGDLVSTEAREIRPFGVLISEEARLFDLGAVVAEFATRCVLQAP